MKYLADAAGAYWLLDIVWSVLPNLTDKFTVLELSLEEGTKSALVVIHDGRKPKTTYHRQEVAWTDFPLPKVKLYVQEKGRSVSSPCSWYASSSFLRTVSLIKARA